LRQEIRFEGLDDLREPDHLSAPQAMENPSIVWRQLLFPVTTTKIAAHYTAAGSAAARVFDFAPAALAR
jgi:hypothetical protein